jgi:hypothetical protein
MPCPAVFSQTATFNGASLTTSASTTSVLQGNVSTWAALSTNGALNVNSFMNVNCDRVILGAVGNFVIPCSTFVNGAQLYSKNVLSVGTNVLTVNDSPRQFTVGISTNTVPSSFWGNVTVNGVSSFVGTVNISGAVNVNGAPMIASGGFWTTSSAQTKENIVLLSETGMDLATAFHQLRATQYEYKSDFIDGTAEERRRIGYIAEEVKLVLPCAVSVLPSGNPLYGDVLSLEYRCLDLAAHQALRELKIDYDATMATVDTQGTTITTLQSTVSTLQSALAALEARVRAMEPAAP